MWKFRLDSSYGFKIYTERMILIILCVLNLNFELENGPANHLRPAQKSAGLELSCQMQGDRPHGTAILIHS